MAKRENTWVDDLTVPGVFAIALVGHLLAHTFSMRLLAPDGGNVLVWLTTGVAVGLVFASNRLTSCFAALSGGVAASAVIHASSPFGEFAANVGSYIIETGVAVASLTVLLAPTQIRTTGDPATSIFALALFLISAFLGTLPLLAASIIGWEVVLATTMAHGIGASAVAATLLIGRYQWISTMHPRKLWPGLLVAVVVTQALLVYAAWAQSSVTFIALALIVLIGSTFGSRAGVPVALLSILVFSISTIEASNGLPAPNAHTVHAFSGAAVILTVVLGRLSFQSDQRMLDAQDSANRLKKLAYTGFDAFVEVDQDLSIVDASDSMCEVLEPVDGRLVGRALHSLFASEDWIKFEGTIDQILCGKTVRIDRGFQMADGRTRWTLALAQPRQTTDGNFDGCMIYLLDTTSAHRVNVERLDSMHMIAEAQELERNRVAQLVHDGALQDFAAANLLVGAIQMNDSWTKLLTTPNTPGGPELTTKDQMDRVEALLESGMRKLRLDAFEPNQIDLRTIDVQAELESTIAKFAPVTTARVELRTENLTNVAPEQQEVIQQIACEGLVNAILHSTSATVIRVDLQSTRDGYSIVVIDDGVGFDRSHLPETGHLGLNSMTALAFQAGGWCSLSARPDRGTTVEAWVPKVEAVKDVVSLTTPRCRKQSTRQ